MVNTASSKKYLCELLSNISGRMISRTCFLLAVSSWDSKYEAHRTAGDALGKVQYETNKSSKMENEIPSA